MHIQANLGLRLERFGVGHRHWPSAVLRKEELGRRREREREERRREYAAAVAHYAGRRDRARRARITMMV